MATRIINLSCTPLAKDETELLRLELNFTPVPERDIDEHKRDRGRFSVAPPPPRLGYIPATEIILRRGNKVFTWRYTRLFSCDSVKVLYVIVCIRTTMSGKRRKPSRDSVNVRQMAVALKIRKCTEVVPD